MLFTGEKQRLFYRSNAVSAADPPDTPGRSSCRRSALTRICCRNRAFARDQPHISSKVRKQPKQMSCSFKQQFRTQGDGMFSASSFMARTREKSLRRAYVASDLRLQRRQGIEADFIAQSGLEMHFYIAAVNVLAEVK